jgi:general stress protein CsbA
MHVLFISSSFRAGYLEGLFEISIDGVGLWVKFMVEQDLQWMLRVEQEFQWVLVFF